MQFDEKQQTKALQKAQSLADEFDPEETQQFAQKHKGAKWYDDFVLLYEMVTTKGFSLNTTTYIAIAGALAYVVLPIDIIPDFIPGVGFVDDIFVIGIVMKSISGEIDRFKSHQGEV